MTPSTLRGVIAAPPTGPIAGRPIGRIVGAEAVKFGGWQRLNAEYPNQFGVETPGWTGKHQ